MRWSFSQRAVAYAATMLVGAIDAQPATAQTVVPIAQPVRGDGIAIAVAEASRRFGVPVPWILAVMRVESGGDAHAVSRAGAIGLMQVMPETYAELRRDLGLGSDPFAVRDNILAGVAYLRRMFDRYGSPGFLAAYNAGPGRWESHLAGTKPLPVETLRYVDRLAAITGGSAGSTSDGPLRGLSPSPFTAPLFVGRGADRRAPEQSGDSRRIAKILVANATIVPRSDSLFAAPSASRNLAGANEAQPPTPVTDEPQRNGLFVARTTRAGPR